MLFSQRKGIKPVNKIMQIDDIDADLRNGLWNAIHVCYWDHYKEYYHGSLLAKESNLGDLFIKYWHLYFKARLDNLPKYFDHARDEVRHYFFNCSWNEIYDFIEFTLNNGPVEFQESFKNFCNNVLESENSGYRFVGNEITPITSPEEIESIEEALEAVSSFSGVNAHLKMALHHLSDRKKPDYRNSIKESISAVEAICKLISHNKKAALKDALSNLEKHITLHSALKKAFTSLYLNVSRKSSHITLRPIKI